MATWLHFIGKEYYPTRNKFIQEARQYGITRRVSLQVLKQMSWWDRVLLATMDGKSPVVFGEFFIERISGLSQEASEEIRLRLKVEKTSDGGAIVKRGCGWYITGATYTVEAPIQEMVEVLLKVENPGQPMVGGEFHPRPLVRLKDVPFRQGFRQFDYEAFVQATTGFHAKGIPAVRGQLYPKQTPKKRPVPDVGEVQTVQEYQRRERKKKAAGE